MDQGHKNRFLHYNICLCTAMTLIRKKWVSWEELGELQAGGQNPSPHSHDDLYYREGDSPSFLKLILTQTTGTPPLDISSQTLVDNLNSDLWDDKHLPALEGGKFLSNAAGLLEWVAMGAGEYHNLLSVAHPDTVAGSVVQGDVITGQSGAVSVNSIKSAGLGINVAGAGIDWTFPTNIYVSDNSRAVVSLDAEDYSDYLRASTFGFAIPSNATIVGIKVEIEKSKVYSVPQGEIVDHSVKIVKGGSEQGDEKGTVTAWPVTDAYFTYGGPSDLWGLAWTYSDINASNFGVSIAAEEYSGDYSTIARVDHVRITVYYTIPGYAWKRLAKGTDGLYLKLVSGYPAWAVGGEGVGTFVELTDTPANYTDAANKIVKVNATPDALVFGANISDLENVDSITGQAGKYAKVKAGDAGIEWAAAGGGAITKVSAYLNTLQENIVTDTDTKVLLDAENFDVGGDFDVANSKFVAPRDGYYFITGSIGWKDAIQGKFTYGWIAKNGIAVGDSVAISIVRSVPNWPGAHTNSMSQLVYLLENDELFLCCRHNGGVNTPDIMNGKDRTFLSVMEVL